MKPDEEEKLIQLIKEKYLKKVAEDYAEESQKNLEEADAIATGWLIDSLKIEELPDGYRIVYSAPHASEVEYGVLTAYPTIEELYEWAYFKYVVRKGEKWTPEGLTAFCKNVQKKLQTEGVKGKFYMANARVNTINKYR